ncbi:MAG: radical SAM family heme chaperone HemW [Acidimicrobiia bacterium]|nr:MAG: radical SAM family heme chaperone HemW [Acidimicrobiia bacterium]
MNEARPPTSPPTPVRANDPDLADDAHGWKSAYVHIPFCARRCPYCDFAIVDESSVGTTDHRRYVEAVISEIAMEERFGPLDAVNFGGGTPSRLQPDELRQILDALEHRFGFVDGVEISLEVNPEGCGPTVADELAGVGFTRVSIGAQSFSDEILGVLGRSHSAGRIGDVVDSARAAGFRSVSLDLIYGHAAETDRSWERTIDRALALPIDHVSTYALTVEPGTPLSRDIVAGAGAPDEDIQADRYELFCERSSEAGFDRYEVSNHARSGHACRYNLSTWAHGEYVGFGLGAHDHRWGTRSRNHPRLDRYLRDVESGIRPRLGSETLDADAQARDRFMLGLRLASGTQLTTLAAVFLGSPVGERLLDAGIIAVENNRVVVMQPMLTDAVAREALSVSADHC